MNSDLIELLQLLNEYKVNYLIIGGQAVILYSEPRYTKDLDIWIEPTKANAKKVLAVLEKFGAPKRSVSVEDLSTPGTVFIFGIEPNRVDLITKVKGATFQRCYKARIKIDLSGVAAKFVSLRDLIRIKKATARPQDRLDVEKLERSLRTQKKVRKQ